MAPISRHASQHVCLPLYTAPQLSPRHSSAWSCQADAPAGHSVATIQFTSQLC